MKISEEFRMPIIKVNKHQNDSDKKCTADDGISSEALSNVDVVPRHP